MKITSRVLTNKATKKLKRYEKQCRYASSVMLNMLGQDVADGLAGEMQRTFEGGANPWTKKAFKAGGKFKFFGKKANKRNLVAIVRAKDSQAKYLRYQVYGGSRLPKKRAIPIAVGQKRNKYGNIPKTAVQRHIRHDRAFSGTPKGSNRPGIYRRMGGKRNNKLKQMISWKTTPAMYRPKLNMVRVLRRVVMAEQRQRWKQAKALAFSTAR